MALPSTHFLMGAAIVGLPALLIGGALIGSQLTDGQRRWAETFLLRPFFFLLVSASLSAALFGGRWFVAAWVGGCGLLVVLRWLKARKGPAAPV